VKALFKEVFVEETVIISKRDFDKLNRDSQFLEALRAFGVDNWDGYSDAARSLREEDEE